MAREHASSQPRGVVIAALLLIWIAMYFGVRILLESGATLAPSIRLALAFLPTPLFALFLWKFIQGIRGADELERRIQLEALAVAFPMGIMMLTTLALVQRAVQLNFQDWSYAHVWPYFVLFYFFGIFVARRRYT